MRTPAVTLGTRGSGTAAGASAACRPSPRALILSHRINTDLAHTASCSAHGTQGPEWERKAGTSSGVTHVSCRQRGVPESIRSSHTASGGSPPASSHRKGRPHLPLWLRKVRGASSSCALPPPPVRRGRRGGVVHGQAEQLREGRAQLPPQAAGTQTRRQAAQHRGTSLGTAWHFLVKA